MTANASDNDFPSPWKPAPHAPWLLVADNGREVASFVAWNDNAGSLIAAERHCQRVADAVNQLPTLVKDAAPLPAPEYNRNDLRIIQQLVVQWADVTFPDRHPAMALLKLYEEIGELIRNPKEPMEYADIIIMLVDLAHMHGVTDLGNAVHRKMKINANRQWSQTATGTMQHNDDKGE